MSDADHERTIEVQFDENEESAMDPSNGADGQGSMYSWSRTVHADEQQDSPRRGAA
jgi:hypothetical protein